MRVVVENLPSGLSPYAVWREFQRAGSCKVQLEVTSTQEQTAQIDFLDIVNANNAVKLFHGKSFGGNTISVYKEFNNVIQLSNKPGQVLQTGPAKSANAAKTDTVLTLSKAKETNLNGQIFIGTRTAQENKVIEDQVIKFRKIEETRLPSTVLNLNSDRDSVRIASEGKTGPGLSQGNNVGQELPSSKTQRIEKSEAGAGRVEKETLVVREVEEVKKGEVGKAGKAEEAGKVEKVEKGKSSGVEEEAKGEGSKKDEDKRTKEDTLMIEIEGNKFLKTNDENKFHCVVCKKEITRKAIKAHVESKGHKALI